MMIISIINIATLVMIQQEISRRYGRSGRRRRRQQIAAGIRIIHYSIAAIISLCRQQVHIVQEIYHLMICHVVVFCF